MIKGIIKWLSHNRNKSRDLLKLQIFKNFFILMIQMRMEFYLGSGGKQFRWQNPHTLGQVTVFISSLGGKVEEFVGRSVNNLRTLNE